MSSETSFPCTAHPNSTTEEFTAFASVAGSTGNGHEHPQLQLHTGEAQKHRTTFKAKF